MHRYVTNACRHCAIKHNCTKGKERRISDGSMSTLSMRCNADS